LTLSSRKSRIFPLFLPSVFLTYSATVCKAISTPYVQCHRSIAGNNAPPGGAGWSPGLIIQKGVMQQRRGTLTYPSAMVTRPPSVARSYVGALTTTRLILTPPAPFELRHDLLKLSGAGPGQPRPHRAGPGSSADHHARADGGQPLPTAGPVPATPPGKPGGHREYESGGRA